MPSPSSSLSTLRPDLGGSLEEFSTVMDREGFIASRVLPVFDTKVASGSFGRIPIEQLLQRRTADRAPGGGYNRGGWTFEPDSFATKEYGLEERVDDNEAKMYEDYFDAELISTERARHGVLMAAERRVAAAVFNSGTFSPTAVSIEWSTAASALPITDVEASVRRVWAASGLWPNALIITKLVFRNLRLCAQILERIAASGAGDKIKAKDVTASMLAAVFDLDEVIVAGGTDNAATEGQAISVAPIWDDEYAMVARICKTRDIQEPGLGRTLHWSADGSQIGGTVESYRDETVRSDIVRVRHQVHEKLLHTAAADLMSNITA